MPIFPDREQSAKKPPKPGKPPQIPKLDIPERDRETHGISVSMPILDLDTVNFSPAQVIRNLRARR